MNLNSKSDKFHYKFFYGPGNEYKLAYFQKSVTGYSLLPAFATTLGFFSSGGVKKTDVSYLEIQ